MRGCGRPLALAAFASASLVVACDDASDGERIAAFGSGDPGGAESGSSGAGAIEKLTYDASYSVPVPEELVPFATYPIRGVGITRADPELRIRYGFPAWLGGIRQSIVLEGTYVSDGTPFDVTAGEFGTGSCVQAGSRFECQELLPGIAIDRDQAEYFMLDAGLSAGEIELRLKVSDLFASDPIGVLVFDLPESAQ